MTGLTVEVTCINRCVTAGTVASNRFCGHVVHRRLTVENRLRGVTGRTIKLGLINNVTGGTFTSHTGR